MIDPLTMPDRARSHQVLERASEPPESDAADARGAERRRHQRFALRCKCWLEGENASIYASTADVGLGGLFLRSAVPVRRGLTVDVELELHDGGRSVTADGVITRAVPATGGQRFGIGVKFMDIDGGHDALLALLNRAD